MTGRADASTLTDERWPMDIGRPKRIIEIEPVSLPLPGEAAPAEPTPAYQPDAEPEPAAPDRR